jgi:predicted small lipoprotein YifL
MGHHPGMHARPRDSSLPLSLTTAAVLAVLAVGCGQKGDLYLAEDDPARAELDARGKVAPFPFPPEDADWPPSGAGAAATDTEADTEQAPPQP